MGGFFENFVSKFCETEKLIDIAPRATARQSSVSRWSKPDDAQRALGGVNADFAFHTEMEDAPWWECTFDRAYAVRYVVIENRRRREFQALASAITVEAFLDGTSEEILRGNLCFGAPPSSMPLVLPVLTPGYLDRLRITLRDRSYLHLSRVRFLCEADALTATQDKTVFLANRSDGLGERLRAVLNAMQIAHVTGGAFRFSWQPRLAGARVNHAVENAEDMFSHDFLDRHHLPPEHLAGARLGGLSDQSRYLAQDKAPEADFIVLGQNALVEQAGELNQNYYLAGKQQPYFDAIRFSDDLETARKLALAAPLPEDVTALHLRAGDIVYGRHRFANRFISKVCPYPIAIRIIEDIAEKGGKVLIFGQDPELIAYLRATHDILTISDLEVPEGFSDVQQALFEICLMMRCRDIIAGSSGFAAVAAAIRGIELTDPYHLYARDVALGTIERYADRDDGVPDLQKAFAYKAMFRFTGHSLPPEDGVRIARKALAHDPVNDFYAVALAAHLFRDGQAEEADDILIGILLDRDRAPWNILQILIVLHPSKTLTVSPFLPTLQVAADDGYLGAKICASLATHALGDHDLARAFAADVHRNPDPRAAKLQVLLTDL
jgi:hypothetical protein